MTNDEIKACLYDRRPVVHNGVKYDYVSAITYRVENGHVSVKAELMDKTKHSVTIANVRDVSEVVKI